MNLFQSIFVPLSRIEKADYIALLCVTAIMPIDWRLGMWAMIVFCCTSLMQFGITHHIGWRNLSQSHRAVLLLMALFFAINLISGCLSENNVLGWSRTIKKLPFILFPIAFAMGDKSYISRQHLRTIFFTLWATTSLRLIVELFSAAGQWINGAPLSSVIGGNFGQLHHTYFALYAMVGAGFIYSELMRSLRHSGWSRSSWMLLLALAPPLATATLTDSRTGILCGAILIFAGLIDYVALSHRWMQAAIVVAVIAMTAVAGFMCMPPEHQRFAMEFRALASGGESDRMLLQRSAFEAAGEKPLWGYGSGDYEQPLWQQFDDNGYQVGVDYGQDAHNQYIESTLQCGIFGTLTLIAILILPVATALRQKRGRRAVCSIVMVIAVTMFFESLLGRQMGIIFFCLIISLLPLFYTPQNKDS